MTQIIRAEEEIKCPLQRSKLNIKGLGDWVVNPTKGCPYGCKFCYVSSTPIIRTSKKQFNQLGILDPLMEWGNYQIIRQDIPQKLEEKLARMRTWHSSIAGQGVVLFSSECDPCPDRRVTEITMKSIEILRKYGKRVRLLTRSTLWTNHLELLQDPGIIVGMSLPHLNDEWGRQVEVRAPLPSDRYEALLKGKKAGVRLFVALAPALPMMGVAEFRRHLEKLMVLEPEVIFYESINGRGVNIKRMVDAGLDFAKPLVSERVRAENFLRQWEQIEEAARQVGCLDKLHIWPDKSLKKYTESERVEQWLYKQTPEKWMDEQLALPNAS
jgi:DNA repair photolyase